MLADALADREHVLDLASSPEKHNPWRVPTLFERAALVRRTIQSERIARIENCVAKGECRTAVKLSRARPGENLNVAESDSFEFCRERILIDDNLANRLFVGHAIARCESIDEDLCAARAGRRSRQGV